MLERTLGEQGGFALRHAPTLSAGIAAAQREEPDLILLDLGLLDGQGVGNVELVRQHAPAPIIVLSGLEDEQAMAESKALGAQGYLVKGCFSTPEFVESILLATQ